MENKKTSLELLTMDLEKINNTLWKPKGGKGAKSKEAKELEVEDLTKIANALASALSSVKNILEESSTKPAAVDNSQRLEVMEKKKMVMEAKTRQLEDSSDHHHQRTLKSKFFISSTKENSAIRTEKELEEQGMSVARHVADLIDRKLGVKVAKEDIKSCHHTKTGLIVRLWDFKAGSVYDQVVTAIKSGKGREQMDVFINFALTNRRASLLYEVRQLVRNKMLGKFFVDSNGSISVLPSGSDTNNWAATKMKLTSVRGGAAWGEGGGDGAKNHSLWTATASEREQYGSTCGGTNPSLREAVPSSPRQEGAVTTGTGPARPGHQHRPVARALKA